MSEINMYSDITITYEIIKESRKFAKTTFTIRSKVDIGERIEAWEKNEKKLKSRQLKGQLSLYKQK